MAGILLPSFSGRDEEVSLIGRMLLAYGELEFTVAVCLGYAVNDQYAGFRAFYRLKSEVVKMDVADAILRPFVKTHKLEGVYSDVVGATRLCRKIRNQYAHSHWQAVESSADIIFTDFDDPAQSKEGDLMLQIKVVNLDLIRKQVAYFGYTQALLYHLENELGFAVGQKQQRDRWIKPKKLEQVPLYIDPPQPPTPHPS